MNERTAPSTFDCDHQPQGSQPIPEDIASTIDTWIQNQPTIRDGIFAAIKTDIESNIDLDIYGKCAYRHIDDGTIERVPLQRIYVNNGDD